MKHNLHKIFIAIYMLVAFASNVLADYYIKHPWNGGSWEWKLMTDNGDGTFSYTDKYGENGCNWSTEANGGEWVPSPTLMGAIQMGDNCVFTLNPSTGTITITKANAPIVPITQNYYIKHPWLGGKSWSWKPLTDNGDGTYSCESTFGKDGETYGCNINNKSDDANSQWFGNPTLIGNPQPGDWCVFTYNPTASTNETKVTITKKDDSSGDQPAGDCHDANVYLVGTFNDWTHDNAFVDGVYTIHLEAHQTYQFKIIVDNDGNIESEDWYSNNGTISSSVTDWTFRNTEDNNCRLTTTETGDYTFTFDPCTQSLSVDYPKAQAASFYLYKNDTIDLSTITSLTGNLTYTLTKNPDAKQYYNYYNASNELTYNFNIVPHTASTTNGQFTANWEGIYEVTISDEIGGIEVYTIYVYTLLFKHPWGVCNDQDINNDNDWRWHEISYDPTIGYYFQARIGNYSKYGINVALNIFGGLDKVDERRQLIPDTRELSPYYTLNNSHGHGELQTEYGAQINCQDSVQVVYTPNVSVFDGLADGTIMLSKLPYVSLEETTPTAEITIGGTFYLTASPNNVPAPYVPNYTIYYRDNSGNKVVLATAKGATQTSTASTSLTPSAPGSYWTYVDMRFASALCQDSLLLTVVPQEYYVRTDKYGNYQQMTYNEDDGCYYYFGDTHWYYTTSAYISKDGSTVYHNYVAATEVHNPDQLTNNQNTTCLWIFNPETETLTVRGQLYRVQSITAFGTYYSNGVNQLGDSISFFVTPDAVCHLQMLDLSTLKWSTYAPNIYQSVAEAGVYHTAFTSFEGTQNNITAAWKAYHGDFYIYSNQTSWKKETVIAQEGTTTAFSPNRTNANEYYNHYWVNQWGQGMNAGAFVGDLINTCLSDTISSYYLPEDATVRFAYNTTDNLFERTCLAMPQNEPLYLVAYNSRLLNHEGNEMPNLSDGEMLGAYSDYIYEIDLKAMPQSSVQLGARYNIDDYRYLLSPAHINDETTTYKTIGNVAGDNGTFDVKIIYDFKTNAVLTGWVPNEYLPNTQANASVSIDANLFLVRNDQTAPQVYSQSYTGSASITAGNRVYAFMQINQSVAQNAAGMLGRFYFFSLPFEAMVKDVYGMGKYGLGSGGSWEIQRYRGDKRAAAGVEGNYWYTMNNASATAKLTAYRGYGLSLNLSKQDFPTFTTYTNNDGTVSSQSINRARLYIPAVATSGFTICNTQQYADTTLSAFTCSGHDNRDQIDSHWHVIGAPGMVAVGLNNITDNGWVGLDQNECPNYIYQWDGESEAYTVQSILDFQFEPMNAYFVQYYGDIQWTTQSVRKKVAASVAATSDFYSDEQYSDSNFGALDADAASQDEMIIAIDLLKNNKAIDKTFITWTHEGTAEYDVNRDGYKPHNQGCEIYAPLNGVDYAAIDLPLDSNMVALTIKANEDATYYIRLNETIQYLGGKNSSKKTAMLYDRDNDTYINLLTEDCAVNLTAGTHANRFFIMLQDAPVMETSLMENATNEMSFFLSANQLVLLGLTEDSTVRLYDASGRQVIATTAESGQSIALPNLPTGIYLLQVGDKTIKARL